MLILQPLKHAYKRREYTLYGLNLNIYERKSTAFGRFMAARALQKESSLVLKHITVEPH